MMMTWEPYGSVGKSSQKYDFGPITSSVDSDVRYTRWKLKYKWHDAWYVIYI